MSARAGAIVEILGVTTSQSPEHSTSVRFVCLPGVWYNSRVGALIRFPTLRHSSACAPRPKKHMASGRGSKTMLKVTTIESDHKVQLPSDWVEEFGLHGLIALEKAAEGIIVRRCSTATWDDVFAEKLPIGSPATAADLPELSGDDYLL
jgi:hypothetical protein